MAQPDPSLRTSHSSPLPRVTQAVISAYLSTARHAAELVTWLRDPVGPLLPIFKYFHQSFYALWSVTMPYPELQDTQLHDKVERWLMSIDTDITPTHVIVGLKLYQEYAKYLAGKRILVLLR